MIFKTTAGETAIKDIYKFAFNYYDVRAKEIGLPETESIFIHEGPSSDDVDKYEFVVDHSFFVGKNEDGNILLVPRQLDYCYDVEQYIDIYSPEATDYLVKWFRAQKEINESFTYYVTEFGDLMEEVLSGSCSIYEKYKGSNQYRMVSVISKQL